MKKITAEARRPPDIKKQIIEPELTWTGEGFEPGVRIVIEPDGRISSIERGTSETDGPWKGRAVLPGMINAHSHAFQRGLRGRGERFAHQRGSFWSWRQSMYELVERMDEATVYDLSRRAFEEMLHGGITTVGEFHYLHHDDSGRGFDFDRVVLKAAADTPIRIVLLNTYYRTGGIGQPLAGAQRRFRTASTDEYWRQVEYLGSLLDPATQSLGVAAHSIRAVPLDDLAALHEESQRRGLVFHMHLEEQPAEVEACLGAYGKRPAALINERLTIGPRFCAVHCTHTSEADLQALAAAGGSVCICPLTEANLGDGIAAVGPILDAGGRICLGTDSNARLSFPEEMRWLEYVQRLATRSRGVCVDEQGHCARALWRMATINGARALGTTAGELKPGRPADLISLDLTAPALAGWTQDTLLETFIFGAGRDVIAGACVGGRWVATSPRPPA